MVDLNSAHVLFWKPARDWLPLRRAERKPPKTPPPQAPVHSCHIRTFTRKNSVKITFFTIFYYTESQVNNRHTNIDSLYKAAGATPRIIGEIKDYQASGRAYSRKQRQPEPKPPEGASLESDQ